MDGDAAVREAPAPTEDDELVLRAAGAWPLDLRGYVTDPVSREPRHWTVMAKLLRRDADGFLFDAGEVPASATTEGT